MGSADSADPRGTPWFLAHMAVGGTETATEKTKEWKIKGMCSFRRSPQKGLVARALWRTREGDCHHTRARV
jgi:hypothetical protein